MTRRRTPDPDEVEEFELAFARLAWVQAAGCEQLPSQRAALDRSCQTLPTP